MKARGVKPTLSPNLNTLATVEALDVKRLLFIGVGCQVHAAADSQPRKAFSPHKASVALQNLLALGDRMQLQTLLPVSLI